MSLTTLKCQVYNECIFNFYYFISLQMPNHEKTTATKLDRDVQFENQPQSTQRAVEKLVNGFSKIDASWLSIIAKNKGDVFIPCLWNTHFVVEDMVDRERIEEILTPIDDEENKMYGACYVGDTGIVAQYVDEELVLGIDGAGYSFYDSHWFPLYIALGYQWH